MVRKNATYGRRPARQTQLVAQCFLVSSSPVAPGDSPPHVAAHTGRKPQPVHFENQSTNLVDVFENLTLEKEDRRARNSRTPDAPRTRSKRTICSRHPLDERDINQGSSPIEVQNGRHSKTRACQTSVPSTPHSRRLSGLRQRHASHETNSCSRTSNTQSIAQTDRNESSSPSKQIPIPSQSPPPAKRNRSRRATVAEQSVCPEHLKTHAEPLLSLCTDDSNRASPSTFATWSKSLAQYFKITKLAEASYGEVYRLSLLEPTLRLPSTQESVLKIIALKPSACSYSKLTPAQRSRTSGMSDVNAVASEVRLLKHMSPVPGFTRFRDCRVLHGRLPSEFVAAWRDYNKNVKRSEFPDPSRKTTYPEDQLWAIVEMEDAGLDLEHVILKDVWGVWDAFWSVAIALAKGEEWAEFEHRDLHLGNICVKAIDKAGYAGRNVQIEDVRRGAKYGLTKLETTIIDYTLSRARMDLVKSEERVADGLMEGDEIGDVAFFDLSTDPAIFEGDANDDYQYDLYRFMRSAVICGDPLGKCEVSTVKKRGRRAEVEDCNPVETAAWKKHTPLTNLLWLHFMLSKMCESVEWPSQQKILASDKEGLLLEKAQKLEGTLSVMQDLLSLENLQLSGLTSATDLIAWAVQNSWLDEEDVTRL